MTVKFQMSHSPAANVDDKTFNAKCDMLAKVNRLR